MNSPLPGTSFNPTHRWALEGGSRTHWGNVGRVTECWGQVLPPVNSLQCGPCGGHWGCIHLPCTPAGQKVINKTNMLKNNAQKVK